MIDGRDGLFGNDHHLLAEDQVEVRAKIAGLRQTKIRGGRRRRGGRWGWTAGRIATHEQQTHDPLRDGNLEAAAIVGELAWAGLARMAPGALVEPVRPSLFRRPAS